MLMYEMSLMVTRVPFVIGTNTALAVRCGRPNSIVVRAFMAAGFASAVTGNEGNCYVQSNAREVMEPAATPVATPACPWIGAVPADAPIAERALPATKETESEESLTWMEFMKGLIQDHCSSMQVQRELFKPLLKWFLWNMLPYVLLFIGLNFFATLAAVTLVVWGSRQKNMGLG